MKALFEDLDKWGGKTDEAIERFVDDTEMYTDFLYEFIKDEGFATLKEAVAKKDVKTGFEASHMLKGVSANLGLSPLTKAISDLVEDLRIERVDRIDELYAKITEQYNKYVEILEKHK